MTGNQSAMSLSDVTMPVWHEKHLRAATRAAGVALWSWNVDTDAITMDEAAYDLWGVSKDERRITFEILSKNIHPADLERSGQHLRQPAQWWVPMRLIFTFYPQAIFVGFPLEAKATTLT